MDDQGPGPRRESLLPRRAFDSFGLPRSWWDVRSRDLILLIVAGLAIWFFLDVGRRGRVVPGRPEIHKTDFTVFTEAGAAFFDGRDPYAVRNPRGWFYLYPPIFALMVSPLSRLGPVAQVGVWYAVSVLAGFGCFGEVRRLWRRFASDEERGPGGGGYPSWAIACSGLAVVLPTLECLQRGQLGVVLLYAMLLGYRLATEGEGAWRPALGGLVLAWAATVKLIPALPAAFLLGQAGVLAIAPGRGRGDVRRAAALGTGLALGLLLFVLVIPAAVLGWGPNLRHLETWTRKVVTNPDPGMASYFHIDSTTNQSFANAAHSLVASLAVEDEDGPRNLLLKNARNAAERRWAVDRATALVRKDDRATGLVVRGVQGAMAALLLALILAASRRDPAATAVGFGLACVGMLLLSPVAWTHYYMVMLLAPLAASEWASRRGRPLLARGAAVVPAVLVCGHYLGKRWTGPIGLLGLGTAAWFLAVATVLIASRLRDLRLALSREPTRTMALAAWFGDARGEGARRPPPRPHDPALLAGAQRGERPQRL